MVGVADQIPDPLAGGIAGRGHRGRLDIARGAHHLDDLRGHLGRYRPDRFDPQQLIQPDGHLWSRLQSIGSEAVGPPAAEAARTAAPAWSTDRQSSFRT